MIRTAVVAAAILLSGCAAANIQANLKVINDLITEGERDLAILCQHMPVAAVGAQAVTFTCIAKANGTTQDIVARTIAGAQAVCDGTQRPPSVATALRQLRDAAQAAANATAAGCGS